jgi:TrmH family RNA methyltransferase
VITSKANQKVKYVRSLYRKSVRQRERRFVVEGVRLVEEMWKTGQEPVFVFYSVGISGDGRAEALLEGLGSSGAEVQSVSEEVMRAMADTRTPQGILAVAAFPELKAGESHLSLVLDGLRDPGNLGTILRSAEAAGVGEVLTVVGTVDVFGPKVVRGAMGAHFRLPIRADRGWDEIRGRLEQRQVLLADAQGETPYYEVDWSEPSVLIVGGEARGPGAEARRWCTGTVSIPMRTGVESLNVAVATSILLFEAARQLGAACNKTEGGGNAPRVDGLR